MILIAKKQPITVVIYDIIENYLHLAARLNDAKDCCATFCSNHMSQSVLLLDALGSSLDGLLNLAYGCSKSRKFIYRRIRLTQVTTTYRIRGYGSLPHEFNGI